MQDSKLINFNLSLTEINKNLQDQVLPYIYDKLIGNIPFTVTSGIALENALNITMFIREEGDVFLPRSLADRNYFFIRKGEDRHINNFSLVLVPGKFTRDRLLSSQAIKIPAESILTVGHPRIDMLRSLQRTRKSTATASSKEQKIKILYAPIHSSYKISDSETVSTYSEFIKYKKLLEKNYDFIVCQHPNDRTDHKLIVTDELLDCDVVITDASSIMFEAWAIGKPVIFPRWLIKNAVEKRFPRTAEAYVHSNRIGLHAESYAELLAILEGDLFVGDDVHKFMSEYLDNYTETESSETSITKISELLKLMADPSYRAAKNAEIEASRLKEQAYRNIWEHLESYAKNESDNSLELKPKASIQLLQQSLLDTNYTFFFQAISSLKAMSAATGLESEIAILEIEASISMNLNDKKGDFFSKIEKMPDSIKAYYDAVEILKQNKPLDALEAIQPALEQKNNKYPAWRLVFFALKKLGKENDILRLADLLLSRYGLREEIIDDLLDFVSAKLSLPFLTTVLAKKDGLNACQRQSYNTRITIATGQEEAIIAANRQMALAAIQNIGWSQKYTAKRWGGNKNIPLWLIPFEGLSLSEIKQRTFSLQKLCAFIIEEKLPFFLAKDTLNCVIYETKNIAQLSEFELGLIQSDHADAFISKLVNSFGFVECYSEAIELETHQINKKEIKLRSINQDGISLSVQIYYHTDQENIFNVAESDLEIQLPISSIITSTCANNFPIPIPQNYSLYLEQLSAYRKQVFQTTVLEASQLDDRIYRQLTNACERNNIHEINIISDRIKKLGDWDPVIYLAKMQDTSLNGNLAEFMENARFVVHIGDGVEADFHVDLWYPYVKSIDPSAILVLRSLPLFNALKKNCSKFNGVYIKSAIEAEWLVNNAPKLAGVLYVSNTGNTVHFLRFNHLRHIFLGHGDSEKAASCHKFFRAYDEVWTAGRAHIGRFKNSGMNHSSIQFRVVGRPTLRPMLDLAMNNKPTQSFLYLPTWEGFQSAQEYTSIREAEIFISQITKLTGMVANIKLHPWMGKRVAALNLIEERFSDELKDNVQVVPRTKLAADLMPYASFLIADISSVISDYLPTGRPIFLYVPKDKEIRTSASSGVEMADYCYIFHDTKMLQELIAQVIVQGNDWLNSARLKAANYFVDSSRTLSHAFEHELLNIVQKHDHTYNTEKDSLNNKKSKLPLIVGHRGAKGEYVENSLSGFKATAKMRWVDAVELDVHFTADQELVVIHDAALDRTTNGKGAVFDYTLEELKQFRLINTLSRKKEVLPNERIPTLREVLEQLSASHLSVQIELKNDILGNAYQGMPEKIIELIDEFNLHNRIRLTSFSPSVLSTISWINADIPLLASINQRSVEMLGGIDSCFAIFSQIPNCIFAIERQLLKYLHKTQAEMLSAHLIGTWIINTESDFIDTINMGVHQITTDQPSIIQKIIQGD